MPKLLAKKNQDYWINIKKYHFGIAPSPLSKDGQEIWDTKVIDIDEIINQLAKARAYNIINENNINILNNSIIELKKEIKKLKKHLTKDKN